MSTVDLVPVVAERPTRPDMVNLDVLRPGALITLMNAKYGSLGDYEVLERPRNEMFMDHPVSKVLLRRVGGDYTEDHFLCDMGLVPYYPARRWNPVNWTVEMVAAS